MPTENTVNTAAQACLELAGPVDAGVPRDKEEAQERKEALATASSSCFEAATSDDATPEILFHAAGAAQAKGDADASLDYLTRAAEAGLGAAETRLGDFFLFGAAGSPDPRLAVEHYTAATTANDPAGMTTLALLHQVGQGVPRDPERMVALLTDAAEAGYHFAQYRLAQVYRNGNGVPGGADEALGIPDASRAAAYYAEATENGNLSAALELASLLADPTSGLPEDPEEQVRLTRIVSRTGHPPAIARMGAFYETGYGVDYDPRIAAGLYARAMESGEVGFDVLREGAPPRWDRETALAFQTILKDRGLYRGPLDAIIGGGTAAAAAGLAEQ